MPAKPGKGAVVAVLKTKPETAVEDYKRLLRMANFEDYLDKNKTVIIKNNISWHLPFPGANTTPWQLEGTILALKEAGFKDIVVVENRTVVTRAEVGEKRNLYHVITQKYDIPVLYNFKEEDMKWIKYTPKAKMLVLPKIFKKGIKIPDYFFDKNIIHLPTVKCHIYSTTTGAMKNAFGGLLNEKRHYTHTWIHETLVDLLNIQYEIHSGIFAAMDGTTAGNGPGPRTMIPVIKDYILASADQVAIDAVAAKMMGFNPMDIKFIRLAHEMGLGIGDIDKIKIVGEDISKESWGFKVGNNMASLVGKFLWFGPLKAIQWFFFRTPIVYIFVVASEVYHDYVWWPLKGEKRFKEWLNNTHWGKLFQKYLEEAKKLESQSA